MVFRRRRCPRWAHPESSFGTNNWRTSYPSRTSHSPTASMSSHRIAARTMTLWQQGMRLPWTLVSCGGGLYCSFDTYLCSLAGFVKDAPAGSKCAGCSDHLSTGELSVIAPKARDNLWHPRCFVCSTCDELLVDLTYCIFDDKIFCERHYAEMLKPRCNSCDEVSGDDLFELS